VVKLRFITAGESHGKGLIGIIEGIPANLNITPEYINIQLRRRQKGYGRGGRMKIEADQVQILSGVRWGKSIGSPISLYIENRDWQNWKQGMSIYEKDKNSILPVVRPRPGHADLAGIIKYNQKDIRNILERSSARETAMRVALGAIAKCMLEYLGVKIGSFVTSVGKVSYDIKTYKLFSKELIELHEYAEKSDLRCPDQNVTEKMKKEIDNAAKKGYSLGGRFVVFAIGMPAGLGSHVHWDRRLDARISQAIISIQAIKAIEIGEGFLLAEMPGCDVMDEIVISEQNSLKALKRKTNFAGGIEGGITNGMPIIVKAAMKPPPTQRRPLKSVDISNFEVIEAAYERSDISAVAAASVVAEAMLAIVIADAFLEKFGGDSMEELKKNISSFLNS